MLTDVQENLNTLMALTGLSEDEAAARLSLRVRVVASDAGVFPKLANDIRQLLERTMSVVGAEDPCDLELTVGRASIGQTSLHLSLSEKAMHIQPSEDGEPASSLQSLPGITRKGCACFAAGFVVSRLLRDALPFPTGRTFDLTFAHLGFPVTAPAVTPLDLRDSVLAGGGGVANGFLWALEELQPFGKLAIVDPKKVRAGNANRCLFFQPTDEGNKAELLSERVQLPHVQVTPFVGTLHDYVANRADKRLPWLISVVVKSFRTRR